MLQFFTSTKEMLTKMSLFYWKFYSKKIRYSWEGGSRKFCCLLERFLRIKPPTLDRMTSHYLHFLKEMLQVPPHTLLSLKEYLADFN